MTDSAHDLVAAKATRLRDLLRLVDGEAPSGADKTSERSDLLDLAPCQPTWTGGWNN